MKSHKNIKAVPVRKTNKGKILWKGQPVRLNDFIEIVRYIDDCLDYNIQSKYHPDGLTNNANLLLLLIEVLENQIPVLDLHESPCLPRLPTIQFSAKPIPRPKNIPPYPTEAILKRNKIKKPLKLIRKAWEIKYGKYLAWEEKTKELEKRYLSLQKQYCKLEAYYERLAKCHRKFFKQNSNRIIRQSDIQKQILSNRRDEIALKSRFGIILWITKINWIILPQGVNLKEKIEAYYREIGLWNKRFEMDESRIDLVLSFKPDQVYIGNEEFYGYMIFYFEKIKTAILECPLKDNAIYILKNNWEELSTLTKKELLDYHSAKVHRIIHSGHWEQRLEMYLRSHNVIR